MRISNISNTQYRTNNINFGKVQKIKFTEDFNPYANQKHLEILNAFKNSSAIRKCCEINDVNIKFNHADIDVYKQMGRNELSKDIAKKHQGEHIYSTLITIDDANNPDKNYITIYKDSEDENVLQQKILQSIKNIRPDFYEQDEYNKFITPKYMVNNILETIKSW